MNTQTISFTPVDNKRLANLCGALDENLKQIENALDVTIARRNEQFRLTGTGKKVELAVTDDGCGFDPAQVTYSSRHFGLVGLRERAAQIGAQLELTSATGRGTQVRVVVPTAPE